MIVDSFRFLPRSFRPLYENPARLPGEEEAVWAPFPKRLAESAITLLTSAGLYLRDSQPSFDLEREDREPEWGDPSWRPIAIDTEASAFGMAHLHLNHEDVLADPEIALPLRTLSALARATPTHISVMGYQAAGLERWKADTLPELLDLLSREGSDGVVLAPA